MAYKRRRLYPCFKCCHIPQKDLNKIEDIIAAEFFIICAKWKTFFNTDTIRFYC